MKIIVWLAVLGALIYGGKWLYDNGYVDEYMQKFKDSSLSESISNTTQRTKDFATDKAIKEADF